MSMFAILPSTFTRFGYKSIIIINIMSYDCGMRDRMLGNRRLSNVYEYVCRMEMYLCVMSCVLELLVICAVKTGFVTDLGLAESSVGSQTALSVGNASERSPATYYIYHHHHHPSAAPD